MTIVSRDIGVIVFKTKKTASSSIELHLLTNSELGSDIYATSKEILDLGLPRSQNNICLVRGSPNGWVDSSSKFVRIGRRMRGFNRIFPALQQHDAAQRIRSLVGNAFFSRSTKLAPIRNPWDALVSWYEWLRASGYQRAPRMDWRFSHWLRDGLGSSQNNLDTMSHQYRLFYSHLFTRQAGSLIDVEVLPIHFETISQSIEKIAAELNCWIAPFDKLSIHAKPGNRPRDYRAYYSDSDAELVQDSFSRYLSRFPYKFESVGKIP